MIERSYYLAFSNFPGIGPIRFEKLIKEYGSSKDAWSASSLSLKKILGEKLSIKFEEFRNKFEIEKYEESLSKRKINYISLIDKEYPVKLKQIKNPPIILYSKGKVNLNSEHKFLAIVGTRRLTSYGKNITELFSGKLAEQGLVIVSGLAIGVDSLAHSACLDVGGITVAVLGNGVDICFPRENQKVYDRILENEGIIISELPPGEPPSKGSFPSRNRIVAGISDGILVTEGAQDSGSLITASFGLEFGRKVFAVPGPITSSLSAAPLRLIEKGAKLVVSPDDVIKELEVKVSELPKIKKTFEGLTAKEKEIILLIENEPMIFNEILRHLKIDSPELAMILSLMEIKGLIKNSGGKFSLVL